MRATLPGEAGYPDDNFAVQSGLSDSGLHTTEYDSSQRLFEIWCNSVIMVSTPSN